MERAVERPHLFPRNGCLVLRFPTAERVMAYAIRNRCRRGVYPQFGAARAIRRAGESVRPAGEVPAASRRTTIRPFASSKPPRMRASRCINHRSSSSWMRIPAQMITHSGGKVIRDSGGKLITFWPRAGTMRGALGPGLSDAGQLPTVGPSRIFRRGGARPDHRDVVLRRAPSVRTRDSCPRGRRPRSTSSAPSEIGRYGRNSTGGTTPSSPRSTDSRTCTFGASSSGNAEERGREGPLREHRPGRRLVMHFAPPGKEDALLPPPELVG